MTDAGTNRAIGRVAVGPEETVAILDDSFVEWNKHGLLRPGRSRPAPRARSVGKWARRVDGAQNDRCEMGIEGSPRGRRETSRGGRTTTGRGRKTVG